MATTIEDGDFLVTTYPNGNVVRRRKPAEDAELAPIAVAVKSLTEFDIKQALTGAERAGLRQYAATDEEIADWLDYVQSATRSAKPLAISDANLRAGFIKLRELGVFTAQRLQALQKDLLT